MCKLLYQYANETFRIAFCLYLSSNNLLHVFQSPSEGHLYVLSSLLYRIHLFSIKSHVVGIGQIDHDSLSLSLHIWCCKCAGIYRV